MAVATSTAIIGGVAAAGGIAKSISGAKRAKEAKRALNKFRMQELNNAYENVSVSSLGADLMREESARNTASSLNALQQAGSREVVGGIGHLQREKNRINQTIASDLDRQKVDIERMIARDEANIRGVQENRDLQTLSGYGRAMEVGRQDTWSGIGDIGQAGMFFANNLQSNNSANTSIPSSQEVNISDVNYPPFNTQTLPFFNF